MDNMQKKIDAMQRNLYQLRKIAGWTAEELANKLGVSKQTISNLENKKAKLSQVQYIAIRAVFEYEKASNPVLSKVMSVLLDEEEEEIIQESSIPNEDNTKQKEELDEAVDIIATTSSSKISEEQLLKVTDALLDPLVKEPIKQTTQVIKEVNKMTEELFDLTGDLFGSFSWLNPVMGRKRRR